MSSYRRLTLLATALLAVMFVVGMASEIPPRREVFPLASWFLFVLVPDRTTEYDVEFRAVDDRPLDPPVRFGRSGNLVFQPHSVTCFQVIQQLGLSLERGKPGQVRALCRQVDTFCRPARLRYDVVKVTYDPLIRYDTGAVRERRVLGSFAVREP